MTPDYASLAEFRYQLRCFLRTSEEKAHAAGLEPQQHQLMLAVKGLAQDDLPTIAWLAERLQLRHHSVVGLIDRLERRELVHRRPDLSDHRRVLIELTPAGDAILEELSALHEQELREMAPRLLGALRAIIGAVENLPGAAMSPRRRGG
jgi:DNA-binding MarR family transcriptional regulator